MPAPSAILAISSLDRFTVGIQNTLSRYSTALLNSYDTSGAPVNKFQIFSNGAFIYGYINRIAVSQMQIEYRVPTVVPSNLLFPGGQQNPQLPRQIGNDTFYIYWENGTRFNTTKITIPYGFYTPVELAAVLQARISQSSLFLTNISVEYANDGFGYSPAYPNAPVAGRGIGYGNSFIFKLPPSNNSLFAFPDIDYLRTLGPIGLGLTEDELIGVLKCYRLLGITLQVTKTNLLSTVVQGASPNFLYTPYIDFVSNNLTKFQKVKDSDTSITRRTGLLHRAYLSGVSNPVATYDISSLGSEPFIMTTDMNTPKVIRWNKDETVYNMDFELYDQYGDPLYWTNENPTEFQMTLLCYEPND